MKTLMNFLMMMVMLILCISPFAFGDHHEKGEATDHDAPMSEEAMMAAMAAAATPGEPHTQLAAMVGDYLAEMTFFMDPSGEPQRYIMNVSRSMDLGGRVLVEDWEGDMMGMPFSGRSRTGYNNVTGQYWSTWADNWSTGVTLMRGTWDADEDAMVLVGETAHPITGMPYTMKSITRDHGTVNSTMEMYEDHGEGLVKSFSVKMIKR